MFATVKSRSVYHIVNLVTALVLAVLIVIQLIVNWVDWGVFPVLPLLGWTVVAGQNVYHWIILRSYVAFEDQDGPDEGEAVGGDTRGNLYLEHSDERGRADSLYQDSDRSYMERQNESAYGLN